MLAWLSAALPSVHTPDQDHALQPQLAVLDLGDIGEFGGQPGDPAQCRSVFERELTEAGFWVHWAICLHAGESGYVISSSDGGTLRHALASE